MIEFLKDLSLWYNLIFTVPILLVLFYVILQIFGLAMDFGGDTDADAGDADIDVDADGGIMPDVDLSALDRALGFINIGKVPLTIVIATFLLFWGVSGFMANGIIRSVLDGFPSAFIMASCGVALVIGIMGTKFLSGIIARTFPTVETYSSSNQSLLGQVAKVVSGEVTEKFGRAKVEDPYGNRLTIFCKVQDGKEAPKRGDDVLLVDYDPLDKKFEVIKADFSDIPDESPQL
jgi:membrane protein implicated in regulation of membrane protease activity